MLSLETCFLFKIFLFASVPTNRMKQLLWTGWDFCGVMWKTTITKAEIPSPRGKTHSSWSKTDREKKSRLASVTEEVLVTLW
jgi:hypothetical protein